MSLGDEAREHVAGLTNEELDAMLDRQLSVRLRHAAEVEQGERTCRDCALVGYHCGACGCCTEDDQSDVTSSVENDAPLADVPFIKAPMPSRRDFPRDTTESDAGWDDCGHHPEWSSRNECRHPDCLPSTENDAPCISIWGHYDSHRFGGRSRYCSRCGYVIPPGGPNA